MVRTVAHRLKIRTSSSWVETGRAVQSGPTPGLVAQEKSLGGLFRPRNNAGMFGSEKKALAANYQPSKNAPRGETLTEQHNAYRNQAMGWMPHQI
jgi:hypothetical protein